MRETEHADGDMRPTTLSSFLKPFLDAGSFAFPVQADIEEDESGQGYALRMSAANGLDGLPQLKKWLGKSRFAVLDVSDVQMLSRWFGASPQKLAKQLGSIATGKGLTEFWYAGHRLGRSYFLNRMSPRVCVHCLQEDGYSRAAWDFSLMTACPNHACYLLQTCPVCCRDLTWDRHQLDTCSCGCTWRETVESEPLSSLDLAVSIWINERLCAHAPLHHRGTTVRVLLTERHERTLVNLVEPLSLGGGLHLLYGLAAAERCLLSSDALFERKRTSIKSAQEVVRQAASLVARIQLGKPLMFKASGRSVVTQLLAQAASHQSDPADRSLAHSIIVEYLRQRDGRSNWGGQYPQLSQLELFE